MNEFFKGQTINVEIEKTEYGQFDGGVDGDIIYFKIFNISNKRIKIETQNVTLVLRNGEEREKDYWLNGYGLVENTTILSNNFKKGASIFLYKGDGMKCTENCMLSIAIIDVTNGLRYNLLYEYILNSWNFREGYIESIEKDKGNKILAKELKRSLERIEAFEEQKGIKLDNISINIDKDFEKLVITGEIIGINNTEENITVNAVFFDDDNEIIAKEQSYISEFNSYDVFEISLYSNDIKDINKIRLFVK